ncbi:uncharacterized protein JCM10292_006916 [Rhodotorula paludigena]|uniref:uncharacterized protein n=1 Tax=Rhodotorula paludigena TaxID=86838 RepID=UPI0031717613
MPASTEPRGASASPEVPTIRTFDPFAPLPSSPSSQAARLPGIGMSPPSGSRALPPSSFAAHSESPSVSRAPRPTSLYVPMEEQAAQAPGVETSASWPFEGRAANGIRADSLTVSSPALTPSSPSQIHPSYADAPNALALHQSPPMPSQPPQNLHSAIPVSAGSDGAGASYSSSSSRGFGRSPSPSYATKGRAGHTPGMSVGTHSLLSSRQLTGSPSIAQRLDTPQAWLVLYFGFNLGLTLFNKLVLQGFPFPWTLTAIQMLGGTIGTQLALARGLFTQARLTTKENGIMLVFSGLYTINIAVSNLSLHLVSVPFHQVVRAMTPLFTIVMTTVLYHKRHSRQTYLSLVPVVAGVVFATYGDYSFTAWGFILTLIGTFLAALKTITTNRVQVGRLKLHPLDLLVRMSPLAFMQCVFFGWWSGELDRVREYGAVEMTSHKAIALAMNGAIAFGLNVVSFTANKKTSALTMTVAANVKQVLTIVLAVLIFNVSLNPTNLLGITLTLAGGAWYARVELQEKTARAAAANAATSGLGAPAPAKTAQA